MFGAAFFYFPSAARILPQMSSVSALVVAALTASAGMTSRMRTYTCERRQGTLCAMRSVPSTVPTTMGMINSINYSRQHNRVVTDENAAQYLKSLPHGTGKKAEVIVSKKEVLRRHPLIKANASVYSTLLRQRILVVV